jgi:predicted P-loop ATPase
LSQYWFIHLDELEGLKSNDISAIKSFITREKISVRKAYGRYRTEMERRASFLGSVNDDKFLTDMTGNRRWLVFKVDEIDYQHKVDIDRVWAQVYSLYKSGFKYWFDVEEIKRINERNEAFRAVKTEEEMLLRYFAFPKKERKGEYLSTTEILEKLIANVPQFNNKMSVWHLGKALARHVKVKQRANGINTYLVRFLDEDITSGSVASESGVEIDEQDDLPF